jgi:hypothetical protein
MLDTMLLILRSGTVLDATEFIDDYATWLREGGAEDPYTMAQENLGFLVGFAERNEAERLYKFFELRHPILGPEPWSLTNEEIFRKGIAWYEKTKGNEHE